MFWDIWIIKKVHVCHFLEYFFSEGGVLFGFFYKKIVFSRRECRFYLFSYIL